MTVASPPPRDPRASDSPGLRRAVGFPGLLLYGLGSTVGAGIYVLLGVVAGRAGALAPLSFLLAALLALPTALSFGALAARYPLAGGALVYVREGLARPRLSVAVGLGTAAAGMISAATVSRGFVAYLAELTALPTALVLPGVILAVGALAAWGIRESVAVAGLITVLEIGGLLAVIGFGGIRLASEGAAVVEATGAGALEAGLLTPFLAVVSSAVLCFYAYLGFEDMVNVAEEVRGARRAMPRAITATLAISTLLYVAVAWIAVRIVPPAALGGSEAPLAIVVEHAGVSSQWIAAIALVAMLNGALVQVVMASRVLYSLAGAGFGPRRLARIHPRTRTPLAATALVTGLIILLAAALPLERLAALTASVALAVFVLVNLAALSVLRRERDLGHPSEATDETPTLPRFVPILGALGSLAFLLVEWIGRPLGLA